MSNRTNSLLCLIGIVKYEKSYSRLKIDNNHILKKDE